MHEHAVEYDIVDYDHNWLPYPRSEFPNNTLFVARSVLLAHHFESIKIPPSRKLKSKIRSLVLGKFDKLQNRKRIQVAQQTIEQADLVNTLNEDDRKELIKAGISEKKLL